ncbi:MAG: hypothetical protein F4Z31_10860 [Gemmatimonadetes bacterium]|nr:hypothetical protein [Gemmatimonadota bacterium]MCY3676053.1 hypothetical protein [Gemmatimonadota bacterium]MYA42238.1 hypothetical protein [Gemmatimonadota bacterium]MYE94108.1 hypothetical protein [Gemmatimonadota bacterium]MYJ08955.1 hypothetical protein [Gemmatimonadota bacterium]
MTNDFGRLPLAAGLWAIAAAACAPAPPPGEARGPAAVSQRTVPEAAQPSGSLRQDQISVHMVAGALRIEVTPLASWVLEAAAPDTRDRLARIAEAHGGTLAEPPGGGALLLFLVSFSSAQPGTEFQPDDLHLVSRGLRERPVAIRAITPSWGSQRLEQQSTAVALYAFGGELDLARELTVVYREVEDSSWAGKVAVIEAERGRIPRQR